MSQDQPLRVLIAEDDFLVGNVVKWSLSRGGYTVVGEAVDGLQVVEMVQALHPDVVIMDLQLPGLDGIEAARQIQLTCPTPVVILTGREISEVREAAEKVGITTFLSKPATPGEIREAIAHAVDEFRRR